MFHVYAIKSQSCARVYIGQTQNLAARLAQHNAGKVISTRGDRPWQFVKSVSCLTRSDARWLEHRIKESRGRRVRWLAE